MATSTRPSRDKVRAHRERLRQQGLRPIQIWVPEVRSPAIKAEVHRQSLVVADSELEEEDQAFIDAMSGRDGGCHGFSRCAALQYLSRCSPGADRSERRTYLL